MRKVDILKETLYLRKRMLGSKTMGTMTVAKFASREAISYVVSTLVADVYIMHNV